MTNPYRALCAELVKTWDDTDKKSNECYKSDFDFSDFGYAAAGIVAHARALLAEPEAVGPSDEEIISQADKFLAYSDAHMGDPARWEGSDVDLVAFTRHALARWGRPAAAPVPEPGEVEGIAEWLNSRGRMADLGTRDWYFRAATLLQQQAAPVPVSERPWERQGWCDTDGRCWFGWADEPDASWSFCKPSERDTATVSLPANALPLPAPEGGEAQP